MRANSAGLLIIRRPAGTAVWAGKTPAGAAEIFKRGATGQANGVELIGGHQLLGTFYPGAALEGSDGLSFRPPALQLRDGGIRGYSGQSNRGQAGGCKKRPACAHLFS